MSRHAMSYTVPQPLEPLNIEELRYWLQIMQEHALFIKAGLTCEDEKLRAEAQAFYQEFTGFAQRVNKAKSMKQCAELLKDIQCAVQKFYYYKRELLQAKLTCKLKGSNFPLFLDHLSREAEYFLRLLEKMRNGRVVLKECSQTQENIFWLRLMADHAKLIGHLLDPSEREFIQAANDFSCQFDNLVLQGRDFASMLHAQSSEVKTFRRFILDVKTDVQKLRDFKKAAYELIVECKLIGIMPELMADHLRREADHFLMLLIMMDRGVMQNSNDYHMEDIPYVDERLPADESFKDVEKPEVSDNHRPPADGGTVYKSPKFDADLPKANIMSDPDQPNVVLEPLQENAEQSAAAAESLLERPQLDNPDTVEEIAVECQENQQIAATEDLQENVLEKSKASTNEKFIEKNTDYKEKTARPPAEKVKAGEHKPGASKSKYKWGGSFPRALGKIKN